MKWFDVQAKATTADVYIYDEIGGFGIPASQLVSDLAAQRGKALNVYINSPGGDAFAGIAVYNALDRHNAPVNVTVDGIAASIASVIAQAGTTRTMAKSSALMIHDAWGLAVGNGETMAKMGQELDDLSNSIADIYAQKAGGTSEDWRAAMQTETWYRADAAVTAGLADVALSPAPSAYSSKVFNLSNFTQVPEWVNHADDTPPPAVQASPEGQEDDMADDTAIRQALGLDDEGDPVAAIQALQGQIATLTATISSDVPDKGEAANLKAELQAARKAILDADAAHNRDTLNLREKLASTEAEVRVELAIAKGKITPANRDYALKVARAEDEDGWNKFVRTLPSVNLAELGSANDGADIELTKEEADAARQMGIDPKEIIAQKVRDLK